MEKKGGGAIPTLFYFSELFEDNQLVFISVNQRTER
jgi:hypothetical protein